MTITPLLAPPEAQPGHDTDDEVRLPGPATPIDALGKPFRLSLLGAGAALGMFARLLAANGYGDLNSQFMALMAAAASALVGLGLLLTAAQRDRFGAPLAWISIVTACSWGVLNWISPPFDQEVTEWSNSGQGVLALLGMGNGLVLAGIIALACVRRGPTLTAAATLIAGVATLAANTILLRSEWPSIIALGLTFGAVLLAWDRTPRQEFGFVAPTESPRVSRAALSFVSVAMCGTALQLWLSRSSIPRSLPAVVLAIILIGAAFASLMRVRREIERRETTLSEWTSWMREIRTNDFRAEMRNFESPQVGVDGEPPRKLSFPNLSIPDTADLDFDLGDAGDRTAATDLIDPDFGGVDGDEDAPAVETAPEPVADAALPNIMIPSAGTSATPALPTADPVPTQVPKLPIADTVPAEPVPAEPVQAEPVQAEPVQAEPVQAEPVQAEPPVAAAGAFSAVLADPSQGAASPPAATVEIADLTALEVWLGSPAAAARVHPLLVAIEAMSLDEFESLPPEDAAMARDEIGAFLADIMPTADLVSWIDGPYFIVAHASTSNSELGALNTSIRKLLKPTDGALAFLRPGQGAVLDDLVNEAVMGLLTARRNQVANSL